MHIRLTPGLQSLIVQFIRAGGYDWVAAEAAGVPQRLFERWLRLGERTRRRPYQAFYHEVFKAPAEARLTAELGALKQDPRFWLRHGPGREQPDRPGWTNAARPGLLSRGTDPFASPEGNRLLGELYRRLAGLPEA